MFKKLFNKKLTYKDYIKLLSSIYDFNIIEKKENIYYFNENNFNKFLNNNDNKKNLNQLNINSSNNQVYFFKLIKKIIPYFYEVLKYNKEDNLIKIIKEIEKENDYQNLYLKLDLLKLKFIEIYNKNYNEIKLFRKKTILQKGFGFFISLVVLMGIYYNISNLNPKNQTQTQLQTQTQAFVNQKIIEDTNAIIEKTSNEQELEKIILQEKAELSKLNIEIVKEKKQITIKLNSNNYKNISNLEYGRLMIYSKNGKDVILDIDLLDFKDDFIKIEKEKVGAIYVQYVKLNKFYEVFLFKEIKEEKDFKSLLKKKENIENNQIDKENNYPILISDEQLERLVDGFFKEEKHPAILKYEELISLKSYFLKNYDKLSTDEKIVFFYYISSFLISLESNNACQETDTIELKKMIESKYYANSDFQKNLEKELNDYIDSIKANQKLLEETLTQVYSLKSVLNEVAYQKLVEKVEILTGF